MLVMEEQHLPQKNSLNIPINIQVAQSLIAMIMLTLITFHEPIKCLEMTSLMVSISGNNSIDSTTTDLNPEVGHRQMRNAFSIDIEITNPHPSPNIAVGVLYSPFCLGKIFTFGRNSKSDVLP